MNNEHMRDAVKTAAQCLTGARFITEKIYPDGNPPDSVLAALIVVIALRMPTKTCKEIEDDESPV